MAFDSFIDIVKKANPIEDVSKEYGAEFIGIPRQSGEWSACCPCHTEHTPSFSVNINTQLFNCFVCGGGSVVELVMKHDNCSMGEAVKTLSKRAGIPVPEDFNVTPIFNILTIAAMAYNKTLTEVGKSYLKRRGFTEETIKKYAIGECTGEVVDFGIKIKELERAGIAVKSKRNDEKYNHYFSGRITIPHWNNGKVINITGRALNPLKKGDRYRKLPKDIVRQSLFNLDSLNGKSVILCEGELDCLSLLQFGFNAIAVTGVKCFSQDDVYLFKDCEKVYILFDSDSAGQSNAKIAAVMLGDKAVNVLLPTGIGDVNELLVSNPAEFKNSISNCLLNSKKFDITSEDKQQLIKIQGPFSDMWNAQFFVDMYKGKIAYCEKLGGWFTWSGTKWERDENFKIQAMVIEAVKKMLVLGKLHDNSELEKHAIRSQSSGAMDSILKIAKNLGIVKTENQFDNDIFILNTPQGMLDLQTQSLSEHDSSLLITKQISTNYLPEARCPRWDKFVNEIFCGSEKLVRYVQKVLGYSLSGDMTEQSMFLMFGQGANGKSTLLKHVCAVLGEEYAVNTPSNTFLKKFGDSISNDVAKLKGARLIVAIEPDENGALNESIIKQLTGGDTVTARYMFKEFFSFKPTGKIFMATNHRLPVSEGKGMWRRIKEIPFNRIFSDNEQDKNLDYKLEKEHSGILNWLIEGFRLWKEEGLEVIEEVERATKEYKEENDVLADFLKEKCEIGEKFFVVSSDLQAEFQQYTRHYGIPPWRKGRIFSGLRNQGFSYFQNGSTEYMSKWGWHGLKLKTNSPEVIF
jgi:DNA primase catalytic core